MNEQIQSILDAGRAKIQASIEASQAEIAAAVRRKQVEADYLRRALLALVPEALHEFCEVDGRGEVAICLPGVALVTSNSQALDYDCKTIETDDGEVRVVDKVMHALDYGLWLIKRWKADDEGEVYLRIVDRTDDLEIALARAVEMGDGREEAEREARRLLEQAKREQEELEPPLLCPLAHPDSYQGCVKEKCAWFVQYRGFNRCAVTILGITALHHESGLE
jgi:hypothetical protein